MRKTIRRICSLFLMMALAFSCMPVSEIHAEEGMTEYTLSEGVNVITDGLSNRIITIDEGKALAVKGNSDGPIVFENFRFVISGKTMLINVKDVGYTGETTTRLGIGDNVIFNNCEFIVSDGGTVSGNGNDAAIELFGNADFNSSTITSQGWNGQFLGLYGDARVQFKDSEVTTTGNVGGWSYAMYGNSVVILDHTDLSATGMLRASGGGNINAFYSGDLRTGYDAVYIQNDSHVDFYDNQAGGFAINNINIHVSDSTINVNNNAGNACNSGYWIVSNSAITMNGNRSGHALSCIGFEMVDSDLTVLHNGYAGVYVQSRDSSITNGTVNVRCNGENLLSYSAGDVWLNTHTLSLIDCGTAWLGGVGRKGTVVTEGNTEIVAYDLNDLGRDLTSGLLKGNTDSILDEAAQLETDSHVLFINSNIVNKDDEDIHPYSRGNTEGDDVSYISNDADLWEDADVDIDTVTAAGSPYIASFTENQLAHHKYDWDNGVVYVDAQGNTYTATKDRYGIMQYQCTDVCEDYIDNTEEHPFSRNCKGTYVYSPLVGISYHANTEDQVTGMPVSEDDICYGSTATDQETVPVREHYNFTGWYYDAECTEPFDYSDELTDNWTEVYAGWEKKAEYTVTVDYYDLNSGETIGDSYSYKGEEGTSYDVTAYDRIDIDTYRYVRTDGDALSGTLNKDVVIKVYYAKTETPVTPDNPERPETPLTPQAPDTSDHMNVFGFGIMGILAAGAAAALITLRRKHS